MNKKKEVQPFLILTHKLNLPDKIESYPFFLDKEQGEMCPCDGKELNIKRFHMLKCQTKKNNNKKEIKKRGSLGYLNPKLMLYKKQHIRP